ncbi:IQ calmodulin-binding motif [Carpediemonas membranifera]|uniref:IQ calmodulin-binding motif n=1 Tax=Carpediemonas membranifera TaxID=201153 RepID=A0A8J6AXK7_9EUKA|nr:IQ calmodulin-binding motif [Carpediemonas membranifera]|eukprot:KAG9389749.1 IQ calmodulin-binding motif [Carpediemonas membranifera]
MGEDDENRVLRFSGARISTDDLHKGDVAPNPGEAPQEPSSTENTEGHDNNEAPAAETDQNEPQAVEPSCEEAQAAVTIQRSYRNFAAKRTMAKREDAAARTIQKSWKRNDSRKKQAAQEDQAARSIQRSWRRTDERKKMAEKENEAAKKIQHTWRRTDAQKKQKSKEDDAARSIQRSWRSRPTSRVELKPEPEREVVEPDVDENGAAKTIQSQWRRSQSRKVEREARDEAAKTIQKGWRSRSQTPAQPEPQESQETVPAADEESAARTIQRTWRSRPKKTAKPTRPTQPKVTRPISEAPRALDDMPAPVQTPPAALPAMTHKSSKYNRPSPSPSTSGSVQSRPGRMRGTPPSKLSRESSKSLSGSGKVYGSPTRTSLSSDPESEARFKRTLAEARKQRMKAANRRKLLEDKIREEERLAVEESKRRDEERKQRMEQERRDRLEAMRAKREAAKVDRERRLNLVKGPKIPTPLYRKMEGRYVRKVVIPAMEKEQAMLAERRQAFEPIKVSEIQTHAKKFTAEVSKLEARKRAARVQQMEKFTAKASQEVKGLSNARGPLTQAGVREDIMARKKAEIQHRRGLALLEKRRHYPGALPAVKKGAPMHSPGTWTREKAVEPEPVAAEAEAVVVEPEAVVEGDVVIESEARAHDEAEPPMEPQEPESPMEPEEPEVTQQSDEEVEDAEEEEEEESADEESDEESADESAEEDAEAVEADIDDDVEASDDEDTDSNTPSEAEDEDEDADAEDEADYLHPQISRPDSASSIEEIVGEEDFRIARMSSASSIEEIIGEDEVGMKISRPESASSIEELGFSGDEDVENVGMEPDAM